MVIIWHEKEPIAFDGTEPFISHTVRNFVSGSLGHSEIVVANMFYIRSETCIQASFFAIEIVTNCHHIQSGQIQHDSIVSGQQYHQRRFPRSSL